MNKSKAYFVLIAMLLASNGIMYQVSNTNPFQQSTPTKLFFVTAIFCHVLASNADMNLPTTIITFHVSGIIASQTLLWILLAELLWYCIINLLLLLVAWFCFFDYIANNITQLLHSAPSHAHQMPNMELQEAQAFSISLGWGLQAITYILSLRARMTWTLFYFMVDDYSFIMSMFDFELKCLRKSPQAKKSGS